MAKTAFTSVAEYMAAQPPAARGALRRVRSAIRKALPRAEEGISYQIPVYKLDGRMVLYFAGWKQHYSIYPVTKRLVAALGEAPGRYAVNDKGTIRFPLDEEVPVALIGRLARLRALEVAAAAKTMAARKRQ